VWLAAHRGETLPPISVIRVGDRYAVRDGHHRVSVARALGAATIDAVEVP
jgi:ParB-like chromosome segregation protein Spo0J